MKSEENERAVIGLKSCCCPSSPSPLLLALQRTGAAADRVGRRLLRGTRAPLPTLRLLCEREDERAAQRCVRVEAGREGGRRDGTAQVVGNVKQSVGGC